MATKETFNNVNKLLNAPKIEILNKLWKSDEKKLAEIDAPLKGFVLRKTPSITKYYDIQVEIGNNKRNAVYFAAKSKNKKAKNKMYCIKQIDKHYYKQNRKKTEKYYESLRYEIFFMRAIKGHPNITKIYCVFETNNNLYMVMDYFEKGNLLNKIKERNRLCEKDSINLFKQILSAINYLHKYGIAHRNIKPENVLLTIDSNGNEKAVLVGFKHAIQVKSSEMLQEKVGSNCYIAPEVINGKYNVQCDIWSLGVLGFMCLYGFPPFYADTTAEIFEKIQYGFIPEIKHGYGNWFPIHHPTSDLCKQFISKLLIVDFEKRLTAEEALNHSLFQQLSDFVLQTDFVHIIKSIYCLNKFKIRRIKWDDVYDVFHMIDTLDFDELENSFQTIKLDKSTLVQQIWKLNEKKLVAVFKTLDVNHENCINKTDLRIELSNADKFIRNNDKGFSVAEFEEQIIHMKKQLNTVKTKTLSYDQFVSFLKSFQV